MSLYSAGVGSMMFDQQLKRVEKLAWDVKSSVAHDAGELLARADKTASKVSAALIVSAIVTGVSTVAIMRKAMNTTGGSR